MAFKKLASALMAGALMLSCAVPAMAAENFKDVTGSYKVATAENTKVLALGLGWGSMECTYNPGGTGGQKWNPNTHEYNGESLVTTAGWTWEAGANDIRVSNHSNAPVIVHLDFESALNGFVGGFTENNFPLPTAVGTTTDEAPNKTVKFGAHTSTTATLSPGQTGVKLGTITVTGSFAE